MREAVVEARRFGAALVCGAMLVSFGLHAEEDLPESGETRTDALHEAVSRRVNLTAGWLDAFLSNEEYEAESNETSLRWTLRSFSRQGDGTDFSNKLRLRLRLPGLENRALLFISGDTDDIDATDSQWEEIKDDFTGSDEDNVSLGLRYYLGSGRRNNTSLSGGIRVRGGSVVGFVRPRYRHFRDFEHFDLRFIQTLTWYSDNGLESESLLQLERPVFDRWFFRGSARVDWYEDEDGLFPSLGLNWRRPIDENRVLSASWNNYFVTEPDAELDSSVLSLRYRQRIWRRWLSFEVSPQVAFPSDEDYDATPGLLLKLEAEFRPPQ